MSVLNIAADKCFAGLENSSVESIVNNIRRSAFYGAINIATGRDVSIDYPANQNYYYHYFEKYILAVPDVIPFNMLSRPELTILFNWASECIEVGTKTEFNNCGPHNATYYNDSYQEDEFDEEEDENGDLDSFVVPDDCVEYETDAESFADDDSYL